jgi:hypothetical protein
MNGIRKATFDMRILECLSNQRSENRHNSTACGQQTVIFRALHGRAVVQAVAGFPLRWPEFEPGHVGFVVDKTVLGQVFSEYLD